MTLTVLLIALQAIAFALWAFFAFLALFRLRARAVARSGSAMPGLHATLEAFGAFARAPEYRGERRRLLAVTAVSIALSVALAWTGPAR